MHVESSLRGLQGAEDAVHSGLDLPEHRWAPESELGVLRLE